MSVQPSTVVDATSTPVAPSVDEPQIDVNKVVQRYRDALADAQQSIIIMSVQIEQLQEQLGIKA